jgi:LytS/YehU family sensor histidine kinase
MHGLILKAAFDSSSPLSISQLLPSFYFNIDKMLMVYWMIVFINHTYMYYQRFREREVRAAQLESQLAQAQLQALKMQLHPHFLFNTLNAISSLMHMDVEAADRMMSRLSDLLRLTLDGAGKQMVTLKEEIDYLNHYLEIEKIRFENRLTVRLNIAPETLDAQVPTLILQPLVENAIKHGIAPHTATGCVEVSAQTKNGILQLQVKDNGSGFNKAGKPSFQEGLGISNTRSRLQKLYGTSFEFDISNGATQGAVVAVPFPFELEGRRRLTLPT